MNIDRVFINSPEIGLCIITPFIVQAVSMLFMVVSIFFTIILFKFIPHFNFFVYLNSFCLASNKKIDCTIRLILRVKN